MIRPLEPSRGSTYEHILTAKVLQEGPIPIILRQEDQSTKTLPSEVTVNITIDNPHSPAFTKSVDLFESSEEGNDRTPITLAQPI